MQTEIKVVPVTTENKTEVKKVVKKDKKEKIVKDVTKVNLSSLVADLSKVELKEKKKKATLYIYPTEFKTSDINGEVGKKYRANKRSTLKRIVNNILVFAHPNNVQTEKLIAEVKIFKTFYKEFYQLNDFSIDSLTNIKEEKTEYKNYVLALKVIKKVIEK